MKKNIIKSLVVILVFILCIYGKSLLNYLTGSPIIFENEWLGTAYGYLWWLIPAGLTTFLLFRNDNILKLLGLLKGFFKGFLWAFLLVLPMMAGAAFSGRLSEDLTVYLLIKQSFLSGFFEEMLFRGFLFGLLFRKTGWGFIPAVFLNSIIFGLGHVYQGAAPSEAIGIFIVTVLGAAWFSWLYTEWEFNLWLVIGLHTFMNLSWTVFDVSSTALGGLEENLFRGITIALTIIVTIRYRKKQGSFNINLNNLLSNISKTINTGS